MNELPMHAFTYMNSLLVAKERMHGFEKDDSEKEVYIHSCRGSCTCMLTVDQLITYMLPIERHPQT